MSSIKKCGVCLAVIAVTFILSAFVFIGNACASSEWDEIYTRVVQLSDEKKSAEKDLAAARIQLNKKSNELQTAQNSSKKKDSRIKRLNNEIEARNKKIAELERKIQALEKDIQELKAKLKTPSTSSTGWHPKAQYRLTGFTYKSGDPSVKLKVQDRSGGYIDPEPETSETGYDGQQYFVINGLPAGFQVIVPSGYTVNVDGREDYVAKIDQNNIEGSKLDYASNIEYYTDKDGKVWPSRTFNSGEVFILMKPGGMTIRPPVWGTPRR